MSESRLLAAMRNQAWERAKGEMMAMDHTYYDEHERWEEFDKVRREFIEFVESWGLQE